MSESRLSPVDRSNAEKALRKRLQPFVELSAALALIVAVGIFYGLFSEGLWRVFVVLLVAGITLWLVDDFNRHRISGYSDGVLLHELNRGRPGLFAARVLNLGICALMLFVAFRGDLSDKFSSHSDRTEALQDSKPTAICKIVGDLQIQDGIFAVNNQPDYGFEVDATIRNDGDDGDVRLTASLNSSEGKWERNQTIRLTKGQVRSLQFIFPEPTNNATNVEGHFTCSSVGAPS